MRTGGNGLRVIVVAAATLLAACATTEPLPLAFDPLDLDKAAQPDTSIPCPVKIVSFVDARARASQIGYIGGRPIRSDTLVPLLEDAIRTLESSRPAATGPAVRLHLVLQKLYIHSVYSTKSANIVISGALSRNGGPPIERTYRGRSTSIRWADNTKEIKAAFRDAWLDLKAALRADLGVLCSAAGQLTSFSPHGQAPASPDTTASSARTSDAETASTPTLLGKSRASLVSCREDRRRPFPHGRIRLG